MKTTRVEVGAVYRAKIGGKSVEVKIAGEKWKGDTHTGWNAVNTATGRPVLLKLDPRLEPVEAGGEPPANTGGKGKKAATTAAVASNATDANVGGDGANGQPPEASGLPQAANPAEAATGPLFPSTGQNPDAGAPTPKGRKSGGIKPKGSASGGKQPKAEKSPKPTKEKKPSKPAKQPKSRKLGVLGAAVQVLAASKEPMQAAAVVAAMLEKKLWFTSGKTPGATLYAAMIREIARKGKDARFVKTDRGLFTLSASARKGA